MDGVDPDVTCLACGWSGKQSDTYVMTVRSNVIGGDVGSTVCKEIMEALYHELYHRAAPKISEALLAVGLFPVEQIKKSARARRLVARLLRAAVEGAVVGVGREMGEIDKEQEDANGKR